MVAAIAYAWTPWYPLALLWMFTAGVGLSGFAGMQSVIPLEAVPAEQRGRAMGAIVLGIGAQAPGMFVMGLIGEIVGPRESITAVVAVGLITILLLRRVFPRLADRDQQG
jgi:predicted MFS family arabinose efflux permease